VNIANRYLGNKASEYETEKLQQPPNCAANSTRTAATRKNNPAAPSPFYRQE